MLALLAATVILTACAGTRSLRDSLMIESATLGYLQDGQSRLPAPARVARYDLAAALPDTLSVDRTGSLVVPLIFYNYWKHEFLVKLGNESCSPTLAAFGSRSLAQELERATGETPAGPEVTVSVRIKDVRSELVYEKVGYVYTVLLANIHGARHEARNIRSAIKAEVILRRQGAADTLVIDHEEKALIPAQVAYSNVRETAVNAMAETLSLCFKALNSRIVVALSEGRPGP
jgi:hypothetical protein